jgi:outer membrane protein TolC
MKAILFLLSFGAWMGGLVFHTATHAAPISFEDLWVKVRTRSPELGAQVSRVDAAEQASTRADLHWAPRLFVDGRVFSTNDPGMNLFSNLGQRAIQASDFLPALLNQPGTHAFFTALVGLDVPIFEGGMRVAASRAERKLLEAERVDLIGTEGAVFSDSARDYARFISIQSSSARLQEIQQMLLRVLERYSVGVSSNPVGYSGLLGLKGLKNRVEAALLQFSTERNSVRSSFAHRAALEESDWMPAPQTLEAFLAKHLPRPSGKQISTREKSAMLRSEALSDWVSGERARFLPKIGLFGSENLTVGSRAQATSTTVGLYLRWSLFDPENWGRVAEQASREQSSRRMAEAAALEQRVGEESLLSNDQTFEDNRKLLLDSERLLSEQSRVAFRLFQSGAIQALQLAEVLNRRVDLVMNLKTLEDQWTQVRSDLKKRSSFEGNSI